MFKLFLGLAGVLFLSVFLTAQEFNESESIYDSGGSSETIIDMKKGTLSVQNANQGQGGSDILFAPFAFRQAASADSQKAVSEFGCIQQLGFLTNNDVGMSLPKIWSYFFANSFMLAGNIKSNLPVFAYYNPYMDAILITQWESLNGKVLMRLADIKIASEFAGLPRGKLPYWINQSKRKPFTETLKSQCSAVKKAFERKYPPTGNESRLIQKGLERRVIARAISERLLLSFGTLVDMGRASKPGYNPELKRLINALKSPTTAELKKLLPPGNVLSADDVFQLPQNARSKLEPIYVLADKKTSIVFIGQPGVSYFYFAAVFKRKGVQVALDSMLVSDMGVK